MQMAATAPAALLSAAATGCLRTGSIAARAAWYAECTRKLQCLRPALPAALSARTNMARGHMGGPTCGGRWMSRHRLPPEGKATGNGTSSQPPEQPQHRQRGSRLGQRGNGLPEGASGGAGCNTVAPLQPLGVACESRLVLRTGKPGDLPPCDWG